MDNIDILQLYDIQIKYYGSKIKAFDSLSLDMKIQLCKLKGWDRKLKLLAPKENKRKKYRTEKRKRRKKYQSLVRKITKENKPEIPDGLIAASSIFDLKDKCVIDHKISVDTGFRNNIPVEVIAHRSNLQWLCSHKNAKKSSRNIIDDSNLWIYKRYLR